MKTKYKRGIKSFCKSVGVYALTFATCSYVGLPLIASYIIASSTNVASLVGSQVKYNKEDRTKFDINVLRSKVKNLECTLKNKV
ncbi:hypothetical protein COX58_02500 [archaeon CG_4_10_14_0_2_um_filter_Archaea_38_6]|nr:MAG: hypothetical protein COS64_02295 [archaeon CG06_land_8_20_14_3_00_37_11]PJA22295.1 MAG: hypothetical protein COX58_02500 [archaeon CG_4_10_14_0_2_um_filter_Archaea_38_6]